MRHIIATVFLVSLAFGAAFGATSRDRIVSFIQKVQGSDYGRTMFGLIELEISNKAPGDYLVNLLAGMRQTQLDDIIRANKTHDNFQEKCHNDLEALKNEISNHARAVAESRELITKANARLTTANIDLQTEQRQLKEAEDYYEGAKATRAKEAEVFQHKIDELNEALSLFQQGKSMIESNLRGGSFVQVVNHFNSYVQKMVMKASSPKYYGRGYISLISYMSELLQAAPVQANRESVQRVIDIIQQIIDELENAKNTEYRIENERIANFNQNKGIWEKTIEDKQNIIAKLTAEISNLQQVIEYNQRRVVENTRAIRIKSRQKTKRKKECVAEQNQFDKENSKRMADFNLTEEAIAVINENIDEFRKIAVSQAESAIKGRYGSTATEEGVKIANA